jgi:uncharacterized protein (DUF433 family)/transposase-like protein
MVEDAISRRIFTTADASRIAGVNPASARRWVTGYSYRYKGSTRTRAPRLGPSAGEVEGVLLMSFLDLIEIQMAVSLRNRKITWPKIGKAAELFRRQWGSAHPFALQRFRSDSQTILAEFGKEIGDPYVLDVATNQVVFDALIEQSLFDVLDFREDGTPWRLWLGDRDSQVVVDPARAFGRPIIDAFGLPVSTLVAAYAANDNNIEPVARWFDVPPEAVEAALRWNASLRRAA